MDARHVLTEILNESRGWLKAWTADFTQAEATDSGGLQLNPLAWQLGHITTTQDEVHDLFSDLPAVVPQRVRAVCGTGCPPPGVGTEYSKLDELWSYLDQTQERLLRLVQQAGADGLERPSREDNQYFRTLGQAIYVIALHENYHVGEINALRKALGKKPIGG